MEVPQKGCEEPRTENGNPGVFEKEFLKGKKIELESLRKYTETHAHLFVSFKHRLQRPARAEGES